MGCELLKGFRLLDLSDDRGALCGKIFVDLGADVIKAEPPMGCSTRRIPPFLEDLPGDDRSLYFLAYQAGKRSITLNLQSEEGRRLLVRLAEVCDFLVESFPYGYLDAIGLGYETLAARNPRLIQVSILPFGNRGPGRAYQAQDINLWAAGGAMYLMGEAGKPPLQVSAPQAGLHAGAEAAVTALLAHYPRQVSGVGQRAVVDMQACVVWTLMNEQAMPIMHGASMGRCGIYSGSYEVRRQLVFPCRDGHVSLLFIGGPAAPAARAMIDWMDEDGLAAPWMKQKDWSWWAPGVMMTATEQDLREIAELEAGFARLFRNLTKAEIFEQGLRRRILLAPIHSAAEIATDRQLAARSFFMPVFHEGLNRTLTLPGPFARLSATPLAPPGRAPMLAEHNQAVYGELLGLTPSELTDLRAGGVV